MNFKADTSTSRFGRMEVYPKLSFVGYCVTLKMDTGPFEEMAKSSQLPSHVDGLPIVDAGPEIQVSISNSLC